MELWPKQNYIQFIFTDVIEIKREQLYSVPNKSCVHKESDHPRWLMMPVIFRPSILSRGGGGELKTMGRGWGECSLAPP